MKRNNKAFKIGSTNTKMKKISTSLEKDLKRFQRFLQTKENIRYGRKARNVTFLYASSRPKEFAKYLLGVKK